ncbi:hypothetical protein BGP77_15150 [Saccharospirillum sp. MSK14-1]|uniref:PilZ domain-containing protein n=1 Tax=Saccharospirillum sp. MSK14-1 TaxID=1897632 RepID=UPI000D473E07|nr:PilZ domain-containing protein [Saccharospirillum sp. MSK14-1]PTY37811.1 hypothetical protein BGP77_15150 [Saccharospirillum sp. MSK14-1]
MDSRRKDRARFIYRLRAEAQDDQGHWFSGHLVDVTLEGMMLIGNTAYAPDTRLALSVELPRNTMGEGKMGFCARVRWCDPENDATLYALGVSLEEMPAPSRQKLQELMSRFKEESDEAAGDAEDDLVRNHGDDPIVHNR